MQDERGYPSGGMDPDESLSDETSSDAWYFETPEERWARQEAKNRALQDAIRQKLRSQPEKKEPFRQESRPEPRANEGRRGLFGRGRREDDATPVGAAGEPVPAADEWSTEPWNAAPAPPPEPMRDRVEAKADEAPMSRWDEMFSAKAGDDNIVDAMRRWSESSNPTADRAFLPDDVEARLRALEADELGAEAAAEPGVVTLDPELETRLRVLESGDAGVTMDGGPAFDPDIEARLRALEHGVAEAPADHFGTASDEMVALDPDIEARLRALGEGGVDETETALDEPAALDPEVEARLRALEDAGGADGHGAAPGADDSGAVEPDLEARLRALEDGEPALGAATVVDEPATVPATGDELPERTEPGSGRRGIFGFLGHDDDDAIVEEERPESDLYTDDMPGQSARRWREIFGIDQEDPPAPPAVARIAPGDAPAEDADAGYEGFESSWGAAPAEARAPGPTTLGAWDANEPTSGGAGDWMPDFLSEGAEQEERAGSEDDADAWAPEFARPEEGSEPIAAANLAAAPEPADDTVTIAPTEEPGAEWSPLGSDGDGDTPPSDENRPDPESREDGAPVPPGVPGAAATSVASGEPDPDPDPWGTSWAKDNSDDPWSTARSLTGVPADASPNWPFPEATGENEAETPAAASDRHDDPWAVNPVDELEARLRALEEQAAASAPAQEPGADPKPGPSAWPAQDLGTSTAWPAQVNYERPGEEDSALYREAGVLETLDEILDDGPGSDAAEPPIVMGHNFDPSRFAGIRGTEDPPADDAGAPHGYLRRPEEFEEPTPGDGTARLIEPLVLVPDEAIDAPDGEDGGDGPGPALAPGQPEEPSWLRDEDPVEDVEARHGSRARTLIREIVETGMLAVLVFLAVRASFQNFRVEGESMFPTLEDGEFLIVNRLVYSEVDMEGLSTLLPWINADEGETKHLFHGPERGDIIVFRDPRDISDDLIKRVIGLPGDTIEIRDGVVYINDLELDEPYITAACTSSCDKSKILIPENEYFVMGDNRNNSHDSRFQDIGLVHEDLIIGKALVSYWPRSAFGLAENEKPHCVGSPDCEPIEGEEPEERARATGGE